METGRLESLKKLDLLKAIHSAVSNGEFGMKWDKDDWRVSELIISDNEPNNVESYRLKENELAWLDAWDYFVRNIDSDTMPTCPLNFSGGGEGIRTPGTLRYI